MSSLDLQSHTITTSTTTTTTNTLSNSHTLNSIPRTHLSGASAPPQSRQLLGHLGHDHGMMQTAAIPISDPDALHLSDYGTDAVYKNAIASDNHIFRDSATTSASNPPPVISPRDPERTNKRPHFKANGKRGPPKSGTAAGIGTGAAPVANKRRCVSNACIACRKRKSKCDGNTPSCAACSSVYGTECVYDPSSDHRRKGVYKRDIDNLKTRNDTLQTLIQAILQYPEDKAHELVQAMRSSDNLEEVAEAVIDGRFGPASSENSVHPLGNRGSGDDHISSGKDLALQNGINGLPGGNDLRSRSPDFDQEPTFESELSQRMSQLRVDVDSGHVRFIGGTSNLILLPPQTQNQDRGTHGSPLFGRELDRNLADPYLLDREHNPLLSWTHVLDPSAEACGAIDLLLRMYFSWHYPYFTMLSRELFFRDFRSGYTPLPNSPSPRSNPGSSPFHNSSSSPTPVQLQAQPRKYCTPLLVNAMLALGCHFTSHPLAKKDRDDPDTAGDHFFNECKRLILENDEHVTPRLTTVQALALMSVREAGCAREERGWSYSGMSFRMGMEMGLNLDLEGRSDGATPHSDILDGVQHRNSGKGSTMSDEELDARRVTFWGCFLVDKCWSNYMGRMPQLPTSIASVPKYIVIPAEDSAQWYPYTDVGKSVISAQPARTRAAALQTLELCEISSDILIQFYNPTPPRKFSGVANLGSRNNSIPGAMGNSDIRNLGVLWHRLEDWRKKLPRELEPQQGCLPQVLLMNMFHQLLYIHLFRPFLQSTAATLLTLSLDPRKICVEASSKISKFVRFYKREYGLRQICNIAAYMIHSACTIHLLNLPEKTAKRDIVQGLRSLEDMADGWLCARRALVIMRILSKRWKIDLPDEAVVILARAAKGRAEEFGLQEVPDEDYESNYLDYRGSSVSAMSPMSVLSETKVPSPGDMLLEQSVFMKESQGTTARRVEEISPSPHSPCSSCDSPGLTPSTAPRKANLPPQQQHPVHPQEQLSQTTTGLRYPTDVSAASSPGSYASLPFPHQTQQPYHQAQNTRQYIDRASPLGIRNSPLLTPPSSHPPQSTADRMSRDTSSHGQAQTYFDNPHPPSGMTSPGTFFSDTGIPIGFSDSRSGDPNGGGLGQSWCMRDHELVAQAFLVPGGEWLSSGLGGSGRGLLSNHPGGDRESEEAVPNEGWNIFPGYM